MAKEIKITIENKMMKERRDMNVYHHSTRSAHMIGFDSCVTLPLRPVFENDYLHVSIVCGPGDLKCRNTVNLPSWVDFEFNSPGGNVAVAHSGDRTLVKVPPGQPGWQLKLTRTGDSTEATEDRVVISDGRTDNV